MKRNRNLLLLIASCVAALALPCASAYGAQASRRHFASPAAAAATLQAAAQSQGSAPPNQTPPDAAPAEPQVPANLPPAERAARKFNWIAVNGQRQQPNMTPTEITEE